jgi:hypothetical protein
MLTLSFFPLILDVQAPARAEYTKKGKLFMDDLTKEQQKLLLSMYSEVLHRQSSMPSEEANYFSDSDQVRELFNMVESSYHVSSLCWKLKKKGYIDCDPGNDLANNIILTDKTIIYMEGRFGKTVKEVLNAIASIIGLLK